MWNLRGTRLEMWQEIAAHRHETVVCIKTKPSRQLFLRLIDQTEVKEIFISSGIYKTVPQKVKDALNGVGVRILVEGNRAGRPAKYPEKKKQKALELLHAKKTAKEISRELSVPTSAIYWWKWSGRAKKGKKTA